MQNVNKNKSIKSRKICSVPQCSSYCTTDSGVSLDRFPEDLKLRKQWKIILRIGKLITKDMYVCSKHFLLQDFMPVTSATIRKRLKRNVLPSQCIPIRPHDSVQKPKSRFSRKRLQCDTKVVTEVALETMSKEHQANMEVGGSVDANAIQQECEATSTAENVTTENLQWSFSMSKGVQTDMTPFQLPQMLTNDEKLLHFTGINSTILNAYVRCQQNLCPGNNDDTRNNTLLVLCKLKTNITFACLAVLFGMNVSTCKRTFYRTVALLSTSIEPAIYWPKKEEILKNMPLCFKQFKDTRVVLDATEIKIQKLNCLKCRILTYSHYKCCHTMKFLVGITPSGLISYVSKAYGGRSSDKAIFCNESIISKLDPFDAVMVDKGYTNRERM